MTASWPSLMMTLFVSDSKTIQDFWELQMVLIEVGQPTADEI